MSKKNKKEEKSAPRADILLLSYEHVEIEGNLSPKTTVRINYTGSERIFYGQRVQIQTRLGEIYDACVVRCNSSNRFYLTIRS